jgi:membrane-bound metal-dependent hydrolase YbcI (DUF457 family)
MMVAALTITASAEFAQRYVPLSLGFAVLDEVSHGAMAVACALCLAPAWGFRPVVVAALCGTLIDIDHAIVAGSIDSARMMSLGARPLTHSLAGVVLIGLVVGAIWGLRAGFAASLGVAAHVVQDAGGPPGVPLFVPFLSQQHVLLPPWAQVLPILAACLVGVGVASVGRLGLPTRPRARSPV